MTITGPAQSSPAAHSPEKRREVRRVIFSGYLGSTIEFYDFLLYGSASALVFPTVFFGGLDPFSQVIFSFGTFAAGYLARPIGGVVFGHYGDRIGRKKMLVITMFIMGLASFLIGLVPGSATIGGWAAVILVTLRVAQGIAVGGEWGGAALMALEHAESRKRGFAASFVNAGAPSGALLGSLLLGLFALLPQEAFFSWGWRIPFLLSAVLLVIGIWVRTRVSESPVFLQAMAQADAAHQGKQPLPLWSVLRRPKALILTTLGAGAAFAFQVTMATFAQTYAVQAGTERSSVLFGFSVASFLAIFGVVAAGWLSDRFGRRPVLVGGSLAWVVLTFPFFWMWGSGNAIVVTVAFILGLQLQSMIYGPLGAFISEQFGTGARYTGASLGYQLATLLGGGFTPALLATLFRNSNGQIYPVAI
ncbi:MAG TPA: MFS transporter, partial [Mycobacterium sp.]